MSDKYVLVTHGSKPVYWANFWEKSATSGYATKVTYTANLHEAKLYDTLEEAVANIPNGRKAFEPLLVTEKELFTSRLKG